MQKLALLAGANPQTCKSGPVVRLAAGRWKFECSDIKDSSLYAALTSKPFVRDDEDMVEFISVQHEAEFDLEVPVVFRLDFRHRGTEKHITIMVAKVA